MKHITSAIINLIALAGALRAERAFFVFDNGLTDIKSAGEQAALLQELGYDVICHFLCQNDAAGLEAALKAPAPHLKLVQINGADEIPPGKPDWKRLIQPLGQGTFDMKRVIRSLDELGYKGPVNLQCYQVDQPARQHLATSIEAWKNLNKPSKKP